MKKKPHEGIGNSTVLLVGQMTMWALTQHIYYQLIHILQDMNSENMLCVNYMTRNTAFFQ